MFAPLGMTHTSLTGSPFGRTARLARTRVLALLGERGLRNWKNRRTELLTDSIAELGEKHPMARRHAKTLEEMDAYLTDREQNWRRQYFDTTSEPSTRLVLVIEGVK